MTHEEIFRQELIAALRRELVGPDLPPHGTEIAAGELWREVLQESPIQRYSAGVLFPQSQPINEVDIADDSRDAALESVREHDDPPEIPLEEQGEEVTRDGRLSDQLADLPVRNPLRN